MPHVVGQQRGVRPELTEQLLTEDFPVPPTNSGSAKKMGAKIMQLKASSSLHSQIQGENRDTGIDSNSEKKRP